MNSRAHNFVFRVSLIGFVISALAWTLTQIGGLTVVLSISDRAFIFDTIRGEFSLWTARVARPSAQTLDWMTYDRHDSQTASEFVAAQRTVSDADSPVRAGVANRNPSAATSQPDQPRAAFKMQPRLVRGPGLPRGSGQPSTRRADAVEQTQTARTPDENRGWFFLGFGVARTTRLVNPGRPVAAGTFARGIAFPLWFFAAICAIAPTKRILADYQSERAAFRLARGQCPSCGRDLDRTTQHCPHCGVSIPATSAQR
jgi:hypothetical protein